ncbi:MAG TPA: hypothetical protein VGP33_08975 [Chloroflexota bacterium]|nr:hypothetical protein [Chloroflexota bacterium]
MLYLANSALDSGFIGWSYCGGAGKTGHTTVGDTFDTGSWLTRLENVPSTLGPVG